MTANEIIEAMGGRKRVMEITSLSKGRISQWASENKIPESWMVAFRALNPDLAAVAIGEPAEVEPPSEPDTPPPPERPRPTPKAKRPEVGPKGRQSGREAEMTPQ